jgi:hypothetical protein
MIKQLAGKKVFGFYFGHSIGFPKNFDAKIKTMGIIKIFGGLKNARGHKVGHHRSRDL